MAVANVVVVSGREKKYTFYKADALGVLTNYDFQSMSFRVRVLNLRQRLATFFQLYIAYQSPKDLINNEGIAVKIWQEVVNI